MKKFTLTLAALYLASGLALSIARAESAPVGEKKETAKVEPVKAAPAKKESAKTEPTKAKSVKAEPTDTTKKDEKKPVAGKDTAKASEEASEGTEKKATVTTEKKDEKKIEKKDEKKTEQK